jgi:hypothetical protein
MAYLFGLFTLPCEPRVECCAQGVTKRCRLFLLTNSAFVMRVQIRGEGGNCGVSANEYSCAHHVTWSQINVGDLTPYLTYGCAGQVRKNMSQPKHLIKPMCTARPNWLSLSTTFFNKEECHKVYGENDDSSMSSLPWQNFCS